MKASLHKWRRWAGVDRPVFYAGVGQAWSFFSGPITIFLVTHYFTPKTQGYFYTFGSVLAIERLPGTGLFPVHHPICQP